MFLVNEEKLDPVTGGDYTRYKELSGE